MQNYIVQKSVTIQAPPSAVWQALTDPEKTRKYFFNCRVFSDWQPGHAITFKGKMFWIKNIEMHGRIMAVEPEKLLQYSLANSSKGNTEPSASIVTDKLTYQNGQTTLSITDNVGQGEGAKQRYERSQKGWDKVLQGLKKLVEEEEQSKAA